jgi:hypothetical protein
MHQTKTKFLIWFILFTYSLTMLGDFGEVVLCIEENGLAEIEMAYNGICNDCTQHISNHNSNFPSKKMARAPLIYNTCNDCFGSCSDKNPDSSSEPSLVATDECCGVCIDIPILNNVDREKTIVHSNPIKCQFKGFEHIDSPLFKFINTKNTKNSKHPTIPPLIKPTILSLRTTTLLI